MEENNVSEAVAELKSANEDELKKVIQQWFESTRSDGIKIGARMMSAAVYAAIQKHTNKPGKTSLRDYQKAVEEVNKIISRQLTKQNDSEEVKKDDGTTE